MDYSPYVYELLKQPNSMEWLLRFLAEELNLARMVFVRYLSVAGARIVDCSTEEILRSDFTIEQLERNILIPHEVKYRIDVSQSTTGLASLVQARGSTDWMHLATVNLAMPVNLDNLRASIDQAVTCVRRTEVGISDTWGVLVNSGNGFHYYGAHLRSDSEWTTWMRSLRNIPEVGLHYPTYQLRDNLAITRVGTNLKLHPAKPVVVATWKV